MRGAEEREERGKDTGSNRRFQVGKKITQSTRPPNPGLLGQRARQQPLPGRRRRGRRQCQEGTVGGGGRPSHHPAPGEGRQPGLPPGGPAATNKPQATRRTRVSRRRPTALSPPDAFRPSAPASRSRAGPRTPTLSGPARSTSNPPGPRLPAVRPPSGPSNAAFTSPQVSAAVPEQQLCQTPESHPPPRALRPGPSRSLRRRRSPGRAEGTGRREQAGEGRGPHGRKRRGRGRTEEEAASGSARARPLGAACALPRAEAPSLPKAAARARVHRPV